MPHHIASEKCHQEKRKTVNGEDILFAMTSLGFENYAEALKIYLSKYREVSILCPPNLLRWPYLPNMSSGYLTRSCSSPSPTEGRTKLGLAAKDTVPPVALIQGQVHSQERISRVKAQMPRRTVSTVPSPPITELLASTRVVPGLSETVGRSR